MKSAKELSKVVVKGKTRSVAKSLLNKFSAEAQLRAALSPFLPTVICIDVGASYFPHVRWTAFLESPATRWIAVEPNADNVAYVDHWQWQAHVSVCPTGLSGTGGPKILYKTNTDSGSSLLPPVITPSMKTRVTEMTENYFFPVSEIEIETLTLDALLANQPPDAGVILKLDTQGSELDILRGGVDLRASDHLVGVETEASFLAEPLMSGSPRFWEVCEFMESEGYEVMRLYPIESGTRFDVAKPKGSRQLVECDAVFTIRLDRAFTLPVSHRAVLLAFYISYDLYEEALGLLRNDAELCSSLSAAGCRLPAMESILRSLC